MSEKGLTWIGMQVGNCLIDRQLGEGSFSWVYHGMDLKGGKNKAFKVSKPPEFVIKEDLSETGQTEAKHVFTGAVTNVRPDAAALLRYQTEKLQESADSSLVSIEDVKETGGLVCCQMEVLRTKTLRQIMDDGEAVELDSLIAACRALAHLSRQPQFQYHGDLKPENIFARPAGITFIDPGFFGMIDCQEGNDLQVAITTTLYYPTLEPDDMLAFGLMLWEIATGRHPLRTNNAQNAGEVGEDLVDWVGQFEAVGQYFLTPLLDLNLPSEINTAINERFESILLKALRLRLNDQGLISRDSGFGDFNQLADALEELAQAGMKNLYAIRR